MKTKLGVIILLFAVIGVGCKLDTDPNKNVGTDNGKTQVDNPEADTSSKNEEIEVITQFLLSEDIGFQMEANTIIFVDSYEKFKSLFGNSNKITEAMPIYHEEFFENSIIYISSNNSGGNAAIYYELNKAHISKGVLEIYLTQEYDASKAPLDIYLGDWIHFYGVKQEDIKNVSSFKEIIINNSN